MSDIFISYSGEERAIVEQVAAGFEAYGWTVWWDRLMWSGPFTEFVEHNFKRARCIVVVWSVKSVQKEWVLKESIEAEQRGILIPITVQGAHPPNGFQLGCAVDLKGWNGEMSAPDFKRLCAEVASMISLEPRPGTEPLSHLEGNSSIRSEPHRRVRRAKTGSGLFQILLLWIQMVAIMIPIVFIAYLSGIGSLISGLVFLLAFAIQEWRDKNHGL